MKLYDFLGVCNGIDCVDSTFDITIYFEIDKKKKDYYNKFINFVTKNTKAIQTGYNTITKIRILFCDFYGFCKKYLKVFCNFADDNCSLNPKNFAGCEENQIDICLRILEDMANGNYTERQYKQFLELCKGAKNT